MPRSPNIVVLLANELGYGDLGCFGQKQLSTPQLNQMAREGMRLTQFYAGGASGAASRRVLLTGLHLGKAATLGEAMRKKTLPPDATTVVSLLKQAGYATGCFGNWGVAEERNAASPAGRLDDSLQFVRANQKNPFLLLLELERSSKPDASEFAGRDWPDAEKAYAAHIRDVDRDAGRVLALLRELQLDRQTLVVFTADNGPSRDDGHRVDFFDSNGKYRGAKGELWEGGLRVPTIAWWPGAIAAESQNDLQWYGGDLLATAAELAGVATPAGVDSDSLAGVLRGQIVEDKWKRKSPLYWDSDAGDGSQAVRFGKWKAIRSPIFTGEIELYDLSWDHEEKRSYSARRADLLRHATNLLNKHRPPAPTEK